MSGECNEKSLQLAVCAADGLGSDMLWSSGYLGFTGSFALLVLSVSLLLPGCGDFSKLKHLN